MTTETETKIFTLLYPFTFRNSSYTEFKARRPKVRDLRNFLKNAEKDGVGAMEKVLADLFEVDNIVISEIDIADYGPMKLWFEDFLKPMLNESDE